MAGGHGVDFDSLTAAGNEFVDLADAAATAKAEFAGNVARHEGENVGFTTTSKQASLASLWEFHIDDLSKRTAVTGGLLQESSNSYSEMESTIIDTLDGINPGDGD